MSAAEEKERARACEPPIGEDRVAALAREPSVPKDWKSSFVALPVETCPALAPEAEAAEGSLPTRLLCVLLALRSILQAKDRSCSGSRNLDSSGSDIASE